MTTYDETPLELLVVLIMRDIPYRINRLRGSMRLQKIIHKHDTKI